MKEPKEKDVKPAAQLTMAPASENGPRLPSELTSKTAVAKPDLRIRKTVRVAVSGDVLLTGLEAAIVDTSDFQRLRGIRQLGTVWLVYPTALHTRFDHSLGTLSIAERMVGAIRSNTHSSESEKDISPVQEAIVRLYALLHDVTHVPFGHTIEDELSLFERHDQNAGRIQRFLGPNSDIGQLIQASLGADGYQRFMRVYTWDGQATLGDDAFIYDIVSNTVCADLLDYLARDSYFCDLRIGIEYRFLNFLYIQEFEGQRRVFIRLWKGPPSTPRRDTLTDLTRLLEARYLVAERAYFHHAKIISGAMLGRALQDVGQLGLIKEGDLYTETDDTLVRRLAVSSVPTAERLAGAVLQRRLHKRLHRYAEADFSGTQEHDHSENAVQRAIDSLKSPERRRELEDRIAEQVGAESGDVLLYAPPKRMNMKVADMLVLWKGRPTKFKKVDDPVIAPRLEQILTAHELLWAIYVVVSPRLTDEQRSLVREACDIELVTPADARDERLNRYYQSLLERRLVEKGLTIPPRADEYRAKLAAAASELALTARERRSWEERVGAIVKRHFPPPPR